jgi:hypothetical protein
MRAASIPRAESVALSRPAGGYQLIPAVHMALAWWAYHEGVIRLADLRVWFAAWEMRARRCRLPSPVPRRFGLGELERLTGLAPRRLKASVRRLEAARLLSWSQSAIRFPAADEALARLGGDGFRRFFDQIPNHGRRVPIPRRILRRLAAGCRPVLIACILGHLLRCLYNKGGRFQDLGRVKASWIAETFGVGLRRVKQARRELIDSGWLIPLPSPQGAMNRWGALVRIDLGWSPRGGEVPAPTAGGTELAPPSPAGGAETAPPDSSDEEPLRGDNNQEPAAGGPSGFSLHRPDEETPGSVAAPDSAAGSSGSPPARPAPAPGKPDLRHIGPEDLADTGRLLELYAQAVAARLVPASEFARLRFIAAAEHARAMATKNPCGLLATLVRAGTLHFATEGDEEAASVRLRRHLYGGAAPGRVSVAVQGGMARPGPELSEDARLVQAVRAAAARAGYRGDPFPLLRRQRPEWTRERWERAVRELDR